MRSLVFCWLIGWAVAEKFQVNRLYYCKGPNLDIGSKCEDHNDCRSSWCAGTPITECRGTCLPRKADGQPAAKLGSLPQYHSCVSERGVCGMCGETVGLDQACTKSRHCRSGWCEGRWTSGCQGKCAVKRGDGAEAFSVCKGEECRYERDSCISGLEVCGICGRIGTEGRKCSKNEDCESNYCAPTSHGPTDKCNGVCVQMKRDGREAYKSLFHGFPSWGHHDYKSCDSFNGQDFPGHCGYCGEEELDLGSKCAYDADCDEAFWCSGGGQTRDAQIRLNSDDCPGQCATCPAQCGDYGCSIRRGDASVLMCGRRTQDNHFQQFKTDVGVPLLGLVQCFGMRSTKLVRLIEESLSQDDYPYAMHIGWNPKKREQLVVSGKTVTPPPGSPQAEQEDVADAPKFDNCATIRKMRAQVLSKTGTSTSGLGIISHIVMTPKTGCIGIKYTFDGELSVKLTHFHMKVKAGFEFKAPNSEVVDGEYELDVPRALEKTLYYGVFMHGHMPMFVRIIAKPRVVMTFKGKIKKNQDMRLKVENALVGDASWSFTSKGATAENKLNLNRPLGNMIGARDINPYDFFEVSESTNDYTMWIRMGYQLSVEVNGLGLSIFPAIGAGLKLQVDKKEGCNVNNPDEEFRNVYEGKQVFVRTQILGISKKLPKCGEESDTPETFDVENSFVEQCKNMGNFRFSKERACTDHLMNWFLSETGGNKLTEHLDGSCDKIFNDLKHEHHLITEFKYEPFPDHEFSESAWTYLVTMGPQGIEPVDLDCDPDDSFATEGNVNDICVDYSPLRAVTSCERDPNSALCLVSGISALDGVYTGKPRKPVVTEKPQKETTANPAKVTIVETEVTKEITPASADTTKEPKPPAEADAEDGEDNSDAEKANEGDNNSEGEGDDQSNEEGGDNNNKDEGEAQNNSGDSEAQNEEGGDEKKEEGSDENKEEDGAKNVEKQLAATQVVSFDYKLPLGAAILATVSAIAFWRNRKHQVQGAGFTLLEDEI